MLVEVGGGSDQLEFTTSRRDVAMEINLEHV
jgi:hypothetical protein